MSTDIEFSPMSKAFSNDPYQVYEKLRSSEEIFRFEEQSMWLLSRYEDVDAVTTDPSMLRSLQGLIPQSEIDEWQVQANWHDMPYHEKVVQFSLLDSDGDIHRRLRKQVFGTFTGHSVQQYEAMIQGYVDHLLMQLKQTNEIDFVADFACHVPGYVIGQVLGAPERDCDQLRIWSEEVVQFFDVDRSQTNKIRAETATRDFYYYLRDLMKLRRNRPQDDLISRMVTTGKDGFVSDDEIISTCMLILMAGHGSTIDVLGSGLHLLIKNPNAMQELRDDPQKMSGAIQEIFRMEPPLPFFHRHSTRETTIRGKIFPAGSTFGLLYGAANRDENAFSNPDTFDISRQPNRHIAFGRGAHLCLGNHLARLNMKVIFETLLRTFKTIDVTVNRVDYKPGLSVRGPVTLPIRWEKN